MKENMPKGNSCDQCLKQNRKNASSNLEIDLVPEVLSQFGIYDIIFHRHSVAIQLKM